MPHNENPHRLHSDENQRIEETHISNHLTIGYTQWGFVEDRLNTPTACVLFLAGDPGRDRLKS